MSVQHRTQIEYGDDWFSLTGTQLKSIDRVCMKCHYRGDGKPTRFKFKENTVEAIISNVDESDERGLTTLTNGTVFIYQVEHILSALYAMNCYDTDIELRFEDKGISVNSISPPVAHLESRDFALAIRRSFFNSHVKESIQIDQSYVFWEDSDNRDKSFVVFTPFPTLNITTHINFPYFWGNQEVTYAISPEIYEKEICWARSFFGTPFPHNKKLKDLRKWYPGLIRELENYHRSTMIDYSHQKWLTPVYSEDEPARHKLLDFIGDLSLLGKPLNASIYVYKPHHRFNRYCVNELSKKLFDDR